MKPIGISLYLADKGSHVHVRPIFEYIDPNTGAVYLRYGEPTYLRNMTEIGRLAFACVVPAYELLLRMFTPNPESLPETKELCFAACASCGKASTEVHDFSGTRYGRHSLAIEPLCSDCFMSLVEGRDASAALAKEILFKRGIAI